MKVSPSKKLGPDMDKRPVAAHGGGREFLSFLWRDLFGL